ncbi:protein CutA [Apteryx mantelli]|uniref:Protein CutA n=1 Tax=Apteryx mantelli TaxID=2696672 RepID=A0ABM4FXS3_9AVES
MRAACAALALALLAAPLRSRRLLSMAADAYVPGSLAAAFVTCPNETVAKELARAMVEKRLAACVNIVPRVTSMCAGDAGTAVAGDRGTRGGPGDMIKTRSSRIPALAEFVR